MGVGGARGDFGEKNPYKEQRGTSGPRQRAPSHRDIGSIPGKSAGRREYLVGRAPDCNAILRNVLF